MEKKSKIAKELQRQKMVFEYADLRRVLKEKGNYTALSKIPRDSAPSRLHNRCQITGRLRGYLKKFKMSRIVFHELAHKGQVPGVKKSSW